MPKKLKAGDPLTFDRDVELEGLKLRIEPDGSVKVVEFGAKGMYGTTDVIIPFVVNPASTVEEK